MPDWLSVVADVMFEPRVEKRRRRGEVAHERKCRGPCGQVQSLDKFYGRERTNRDGSTETYWMYTCIQCFLKARLKKREARGMIPRPLRRKVIKL